MKRKTLVLMMVLCFAVLSSVTNVFASTTYPIVTLGSSVQVNSSQHDFQFTAPAAGTYSYTVNTVGTRINSPYSWSTINIYDMQGQLIATQTAHSNPPRSQMDVGQCTNTIKVTMANGQTYHIEVLYGGYAASLGVTN